MNAIQTYGRETWNLIAEMGPYLLLGFLVAGLLHKWVRAHWIERHLGARGLKSIVAASFFGVPMPLCSCGVIPVTASLRNQGASKGAAASFLTSTPQTGVDSILATYGMLGPLFSAYRVVVAFISGVAVGAIVERFGNPEPARPAASDPEQSNPDDNPPTWKESFRYGVVTLPADIASSLTIGFLLAGLISFLAPDDLLANLPGGVISSILLTTLIATPFYICSTGSIPLAIALVDSGLPISAALVLLIAGPATNIATITTMRKSLGGKETVLYVSSIILASWIAALVFHNFLDTGTFATGHFHDMGLSTWHHLSGIVLLGMIGSAYIASRLANRSRDESSDENWNSPETATLAVKGMTCSHCQQSVQQALQKLPFVEHAQVELQSGKARIGGSGIDEKTVAESLDSIGFTVSNFSLQKTSNA